MYETRWTGLSRPSWEWQMELLLSRHENLRSWADTPNQHRHTNRLYRRMRTGAARREFSWSNGERFLAPDYDCVSHPDWLRRNCSTELPNGAHFGYNGDDILWWLGKISATTPTDGVYLLRFLDDPGPIKLPLSPARYAASTRAVRGSWCLQTHLASASARGVQHNVDESRGAAVDSWFSLLGCTRLFFVVFLEIRWVISYFLMFSEFSGRDFPARYVPCGLFLLGRVGDGFCVFCPAYPPAQCRGWTG